MRIKILLISGSLQNKSSNTALLNYLIQNTSENIQLEFSQSLAVLPHYNSDLDTDSPPVSVDVFRNQLLTANAVIIASPEYAHSVPGSLKNALDWVVGSGELVYKRVAIMSASPGLDGGNKALDLLAYILEVMSAKVSGRLGVDSIRKKVDADGNIVDENTLKNINAFFVQLVNQIRQDMLIQQSN